MNKQSTNLSVETISQHSSKHIPICKWPETERPREKLIKLGAEVLSDSELLAIFLGTGCQGQSAVSLARELISQFNGLKGLLAAPANDLLACKGVGNSKYALLKAVRELGRRALAEHLQRGSALDSPQATYDYLRYWLVGKPYEVFCVLMLDNQHRVISAIELFRGTLSRASVYPREVVQEGLKCNAAAMILAHNHPSGVAEPSSADRDITSRICSAAELLDIRVLDHIMVGDTECVSFAERGWI